MNHNTDIIHCADCGQPFLVNVDDIEDLCPDCIDREYAQRISEIAEGESNIDFGY